MFLTIFLTIFLVILDRFVKLWVISTFDLFESSPLIPNLVQLTYVQNKGAAWSLFTGRLNSLIVISLLAIAYFSYLAFKNRKQGWRIQIIYGMILGGSLGNLMDRILYGYVIDMIDLQFIDFPVFNVADMSISIGIILLSLYIFFYTDEGVL